MVREREGLVGEEERERKKKLTGEGMEIVV